MLTIVGRSLRMLAQEFSAIIVLPLLVAPTSNMLRGLILPGSTHINCSPKRPKDKAKVESGVGFAQTCILGRLRNQTLFSLAEANDHLPITVIDAL